MLAKDKILFKGDKMTVTLFEYHLLKFASLATGYLLVFGVFFPAVNLFMERKETALKTMVTSFLDVLLDMATWLIGAYLSYVVVSAYKVQMAGGIENPSPYLFLPQLKHLPSNEFGFFLGAGFVFMIFRVMWRLMISEFWELLTRNRESRLTQILLDRGVPGEKVKRYKEETVVFNGVLSVIFAIAVWPIYDGFVTVQNIGYIFVPIAGLGLIVGAYVLNLLRAKRLILRYKPA